MFLINPYRFGAPAAWSPAALFAAGEGGFWYDPSDLSTMYQDAAGTIPVTAVEQPVGYLVDKSVQNPEGQWSVALDLGDSLSVASNSAFDLGSGDWTIEMWALFALNTNERGLVSCYGPQDTGTGGFSLRLSRGNTPAGLRLVCSIPGSDAILQAAWIPLSLVWYHIAAVRQGSTLRLYVDGAQIGSTSISIAVGSPPTVPFVIGTAQTVAGSDFYGNISNVRLVKGTCLYPDGTTFTPPTGPLTAISGTSILTCRDRFIRDAGPNNFSVARVSVPEPSTANPFNNQSVKNPSDLWQTNAASRPVLRSRYNLFTFSEEINNTVWAKDNATIDFAGAAAPDGTNSADLLYPTNSGSVSYVRQLVNTSARFVVSFYAKAAGKSVVWLYAGNSTTAGFVYFDLSDQTTQIVSGSVTTWDQVSISAVGGGWFRLSARTSGVVTLLASDGIGYGVSDAKGSIAITKNGTDGAYIWGAQSLTAENAALIGNKYQRTVASTSYDSVGFPTYLEFDGSDDCLFTPGLINWSVTDEITIHAGVTRIGNSATGVIAESSANASSVNGSWAIFGPTSALSNFSFTSRGTVAANAISASSYPSPASAVITGIGNISEPRSEIRINGASAAVSTGNQGSGFYAGRQLFLGARNNATTRARYRLFSMIGRTKLSTAQEIADAEAWVNERTKAY